MVKIATSIAQYAWCPLCRHLVPNANGGQSHLDTHFGGGSQ